MRIAGLRLMPADTKRSLTCPRCAAQLMWVSRVFQNQRVLARTWVCVSCRSLFDDLELRQVYPREVASAQPKPASHFYPLM